MYMSRVRLDPGAISPTDLSRILGGGGYRLHQAIWDLFESNPDSQRDFLYRQESGTTTPTFLVLSKREPIGRDKSWRIETKPYHPHIQAGDQLSFSVRINPVVSRRDESGKQHRHDVVMDRKRTLRESDQNIPQSELVQQAAQDWLEPRARRSGFELVDANLLAEGYQQHRLSRGKGKPIRFSTLDLSGRLEVTNTEKFLSIACNGLGPAKAFGCGLLLLRRS